MNKRMSSVGTGIEIIGIALLVLVILPSAYQWLEARVAASDARRYEVERTGDAIEDLAVEIDKIKDAIGK